MRTPLSNRPWSLYRVPADQISNWHQISSAPVIHVAGKSYGAYRVAFDESYLPWLCKNRFEFEHDPYPRKPAPGEIRVYGKATADNNARARFHKDGFNAIFSGYRLGLDMCYRNATSGQQQVQLEWAILWRDIVNILIHLRRIALTIARNLTLCSVLDSPNAFCSLL
jgi:hypothetical protein